jgi:hypothetical protein
MKWRHGNNCKDVDRDVCNMLQITPAYLYCVWDYGIYIQLEDIWVSRICCLLHKPRTRLQRTGKIHSQETVDSIAMEVANSGRSFSSVARRYGVYHTVIL